MKNIVTKLKWALPAGLVCGFATTGLSESGQSSLNCWDPSHLHCTASHGEASRLFEPELSITVDAQLDVSDVDENEDDENLRIDALELQVSGSLARNIRGTAVLALEQEYEDGDSETETELEEAFVRISDLPAGLEIRAGRMLVPFGMLNQSHSHGWVFADTPAPLEEMFGDHVWFDDGVQVRWVNQAEPSEMVLGLTLALFNGRTPGHDHDHGDEEHGHEEEGHEDGEHADDEDHEEGEHADDEDHHEDEGADEELVDWEGKVWLARVFTSLPFREHSRMILGGSVTGDEGSDTVITAGDLTLMHDIDGSLQRLLWQTEIFQADQDERDSSPFGLFSALSLDLNHHWQIGGRYDFTERLLDDRESVQAGTAFVTYRFAQQAYLRGQFKHTDPDHGESENLGIIQLVWGLGKHSPY